jgi:hypothetical protein
VAGPLRRDHADVDALRRLDVAEADVEAVREEQRVALGDVRRDRLGVELALLVVRHEDHDHVGLLDRLGGRHDAQPLGLRLGAAPAVLVEPDADVDPRVAQAQRVRVTLAAVAQDGDLPSGDHGQVGVVVVVHLGHGGRLLREVLDVRKARGGEGVRRCAAPGR